MKKNSFSSLLILCGVGIALLGMALDILVPKVNIYTAGTIFYMFVLVFSLVLMIRGARLKIDSSLMLGVALFGVAVIGFVEAFFGVAYSMLWPYYALAVSVAQLVTGVVFADILFIFFGMQFLFIFIFSLLFSLAVINLVWYILAMILGVIIITFVYNGKHNR